MRSACVTSTCRSRQKRSGAPWLLHRGFFEALDARRERHPAVRRARPDVALDLEPARVVQSAAGHGAAAGKDLRGPGDRGAAVGAELGAQPAAALVGAVLVRLELAAQQLEVLGLEIDADAESAAGAQLAGAAMAHAGAKRRVGHAVAHRAARAAAFVHSHARITAQLSSPDRPGACCCPEARAKARCRPRRWWTSGRRPWRRFRPWPRDWTGARRAGAGPPHRRRSKARRLPPTVRKSASGVRA